MEGMMLEKLFGRPEYLITLEVFNRYTRIDFYYMDYYQKK